MKKLLLSILLLLPISCFAQFSDSYNYYLYVECGNVAESASSFYYAHFDRNTTLYCDAISKSNIVSKHSNDVIDEYAINKRHEYTYDANMSTSKYVVYRKQRTEMRTMPPFVDMYGNVLTVPNGYHYCAFSKDRTEMIRWYTTKYDNTPKQKKHYKLADIEDIVPNSNGSDYDFLY